MQFLVYDIIGEGFKMGVYELMVLIAPDLEGSSKNQIVNSLKETITSVGGIVVSDQDWDNKELAYPIAKFNQANYLYFEAEIPPEAVLVVDKKIRINESVIRHLLLKKTKIKRKAAKLTKPAVVKKTEVPKSERPKVKRVAKRSKESKE